MNCSHCNKELPDNSKICNQCGELTETGKRFMHSEGLRSVMPRRWFRVCIFLFVAFALSLYFQLACYISSIFSKKDNAAYQWKEFSPPGSKCSLLFPGIPIHGSQKLAILIHKLDYTRDLYSCSVADSMVYALDINTYSLQLSNSVQQSILIQSLNEIVYYKEWNRLMDTDFGEVDGNRSLDYLVQLGDSSFMKGRIIMTEQHQYHLKHIFKAGKFDEGKYRKFVESFFLPNR